MYTDLYLKFSDEAQANEYLYTQVPTEWDDSDPDLLIPTAWEPRANFANIDVIGVIYEPQEIVDPENPPEPVALEGWHVNVRIIDEDPTPLEPFMVEPAAPRRVWG